MNLGKEVCYDDYTQKWLILAGKYGVLVAYNLFMHLSEISNYCLNIFHVHSSQELIQSSVSRPMGLDFREKS